MLCVCMHNNDIMQSCVFGVMCKSCDHRPLLQDMTLATEVLTGRQAIISGWIDWSALLWEEVEGFVHSVEPT